VPDLVEKRKVFLKGGWAYVPASAQSSIVFQEFDLNLEKALEVGYLFPAYVDSTPTPRRS
jgi:DNA primase large subunit